MALAPGMTPEQRAAVEMRRCSVALSAGAGCGKTHVLTERFLSHLDPEQSRRTARLAQLIAITFTDKAAREMRERVRRKCYERLAAARSEDEARYWRELLQDLSSARISTIHSFCGSLLRSHAVEAGFDPRFTVLDGQQADTMLSETIDDELRRQLAVCSPAAVEMLFRHDMNRVREMIGALLKERRRLDARKWIDAGVEGILAAWQAYHEDRFRPELLHSFCALPCVREIMEIIRTYPADQAKMQERCDRLAELLPQLAALDPRDISGSVLTEIRENAKVQGAGKAWGSGDVYEQFKNAATALRSAIDKLVGYWTFNPVAARQQAESGLWLFEMTVPIINAYEQRKQECNALDFNDLIVAANDLLRDPAHRDLRRGVADQIELLLVDEFQDTNPAQVELVELLCADALERGKLFFVGDHRQSIYRFLGASPDVFRRLKERIPNAGQLALTLNFRSQPGILNFVNALFANALQDDAEALSPARERINDSPVVEFLWATIDEAALAAGAGPSAETLRLVEADWIARRLRELIDQGANIVADNSHDGARETARAVRPGDITILFRAMSDVQHYENALRHYGLPYYVVGGRAFYAQQEIYDVLNLLRALASPADEVALAGALRSPMFNLTDSALFALTAGSGGLAAGLFSSKSNDLLSPADRDRAQFARETLTRLRCLKDRVSVADLLIEILSRTGYDAALVTEFLGERKLANLQKLLDQSRAFDAGGMGLADFITQLSEFVVSQPDEALAATHAEGADVVRLMSIHQAKGLEFPLVVVADLERQPNRGYVAAAYDNELGPLVPASRDEGGFGGLEMLRQVETPEEEAERVRLLYVATTRAADYLILSAGCNSAGVATSPARQLLAAHFDLETGACKNAHIPAGREPQVHVTTVRPQADPVQQEPRRANLDDVAREAMKHPRQRSPREAARMAPILPDRSHERAFSFSRLSGALEAWKPEQEEDGASADLRASDPREFGTLLHAVLAAAPWPALKDLPDRVRRLAMRQGFTNDEELAAAVEILSRFLDSSRGQAVSQAKKTHRELEFLLSWPPDQAESQVYLHGYIDYLYQDDAGRWHLIDYKTNVIPKGRVRQVAAAYEMQMLLYALAVERTLGVAPASVTLCFLRSGVEHSFAWNDEVRAHLIEMVNHALAEVVRLDEKR